MRAFLKAPALSVLIFLTSACAAAPPPPPSDPETACYHPHWTIPLDFNKVRRAAQRTFIQHTGSSRYLTIFSPGPFERSYYFVMSPDPSEASIEQSEHKGVMLDTDGKGRPDCFILGGGTLPDAKGEPVPYNFFAIDRDGNGRIEAFISEDLDLDGDHVMDQYVRALMTDPDPEGHFRRGTYQSDGASTPIPKAGFDFLLKKPLYDEPVPFADNEATQMTLFAELEKIWKELQGYK
ncbi:MAG TPA: hypothetical protein VLY20_06405 [Nitrospiria bacterium]|nr:hypothetical protein [Nitrospiria bacterium]